MGTFFTPGDFPDIGDAATLIEDAEALAMLSAPCLTDPDLVAYKKAAAKAIIRGAILRWNEAGAGATVQQNAGPFAMTTTSQARRNAYWPSEIVDLQKICKGDDAGKAYGVDTVPVVAVEHAVTCSVNFGVIWCSCGADIAGRPIYGTGA